MVQFFFLEIWTIDTIKSMFQQISDKTSCLHLFLSSRQHETVWQRCLAIFTSHWLCNPAPTILVKSLGTVLQYSYYSVISRFPFKTVHPFRNFVTVLPPPTQYKSSKTRKKFWIHASNIVCGVRGGVGPVWIGKRPRNAKVSQDFCPWL